MRVVLRLIGRKPLTVWPDGWPVPHVDELITTLDGDTYTVTAVTYYPEGESAGDEPFAYVVARQF